MVTPIRLLMSDVTVCPLWIETPRFRWTAPLSQSRYCTKNESFRWYFASRAAMADGLAGWVPRRTWIAFPGARYRRPKIRNEISRSRTTRARRRRVRKNVICRARMPPPDVESAGIDANYRVWPKLAPALRPGL